jgi:hypothetical protein
MTTFTILVRGHGKVWTWAGVTESEMQRLALRWARRRTASIPGARCPWKPEGPSTRTFEPVAELWSAYRARGIPARIGAKAMAARDSRATTAGRDPGAREHSSCAQPIAAQEMPMTAFRPRRARPRRPSLGADGPSFVRRDGALPCLVRRAQQVRR